MTKARIVALVALALAAGSATAASVTAGWQNFSFSLQDLDSADGVTPWLHATEHDTAVAQCLSASFCGAGPVRPGR